MGSWDIGAALSCLLALQVLQHPNSVNLQNLGPDHPTEAGSGGMKCRHVYQTGGVIDKSQ